MDYKKTNAEVTTVTRNVRELDKDNGNIYETIAILGKRANQIQSDIKEELTGKLAEFATHTDNLEEIFENREQIEISKFYERLPKPSDMSIAEFQDGKVYHRNPLNETQAENN